jgi:hypothetical protein
MSATKSTTVHNEQLKLGATAASNLGVAFFATGIIVPLVALAYQNGTPHNKYWVAFAALWLTMSGALHMAGRYILEGLRP